MLEALDQHSALLVDDQVERADHAVAAVLLQPRGRGVEQRIGDLLVVLEVEEPEESPAVAVEAVEVLVVLSTDPADHAAVPPGQEELAVAVL